MPSRIHNGSHVQILHNNYLEAPGHPVHRESLLISGLNESMTESLGFST